MRTRLTLLGLLLLWAFPALAQQQRGNLNAVGTSCNSPGPGALVLAITDSRTGGAIQLDPTFVGTVQFYASSNSAAWTAIAGTPQQGGAAVTSATTAGTWQFGIAGLNGLCALMSAYTSGAAIVTISATNGVPPTGGGTVTVTGTVSVDPVANTIGLSTGAKQDEQTALLTTIDTDTGNTATSTAAVSTSIGATTVDRCTTTDITSCTLEGIAKQLSYLLSNPACPNSIIYDTNTNGKTQLVALSSGKIIYVCGVHLVNFTTSAVTVSLGTGTGTNCGTTYTAKTPAWPLDLDTVAGVGLQTSATPWFQTAVSEELCISTNAAVSVQAIVVYGQP